MQIDTYFRPSTFFVVDQMAILMGIQIRSTKNNKTLIYLENHSKIEALNINHSEKNDETYPRNDRAEFLAELASGFDVVL